MVEREMIYLIETYRFQRKDSFSLQLAFDFHLKYEQIHPFENGNGRTGRLIMNKILLQNAMIPMIVYTENKQSYSNSIASSNS
jgi:Fic family protein